MLFQSGIPTLTIILVVSATIVISFILFAVGTYALQRYAKSKKWDESYKLALKINILWLISSLLIGIPISMFAGDNVLIDILRFGINMVVGIIMVKKLYKKPLGESAPFVLMLQIILFIIAILFGYTFNGIIAPIVLS